MVKLQICHETGSILAAVLGMHTAHMTC